MAIESATYVNDLVNTNPPGGDNAATADDHLRLIKAVLKATIPFTGAVTSTHTELNKLAGYTGVLPKLASVQAWTAQQYFPTFTLTDAVNILWNLNSGQVAEVTLGGNRTLDTPLSGMIDGTTVILRIKQDGVGSRTLAYGSGFKFPGGIAPTLPTGANAVSILSCLCDGTDLHCTATLDYS